MACLLYLKNIDSFELELVLHSNVLFYRVLVFILLLWNFCWYFLYYPIQFWLHIWERVRLKILGIFLLLCNGMDQALLLIPTFILFSHYLSGWLLLNLKILVFIFTAYTLYFLVFLTWLCFMDSDLRYTLNISW